MTKLSESQVAEIKARDKAKYYTKAADGSMVVDWASLFDDHKALLSDRKALQDRVRELEGAHNFWRDEALRWAEACGNAVGALQDAVPKLCKWCAEGEPISADEDGVNREGRYHHVKKWGLGLRPCSAVEQRKILDAIGGYNPTAALKETQHG